MFILDNTLTPQFLLTLNFYFLAVDSIDMKHLRDCEPNSSIS